MKNMQQFIQQAQKMQQKMEEMQSKLAEMLIEGKAGGGLVKVMVSGRSELKKVTIDPSLLAPDEKEVLEDLIVAAFNDGKAQAEKSFQDAMSDVTGGQLPPGFKMPM